MFWNKKIRYEPIASILPLKRYKRVCEFLLVVNNEEEKLPENKGNKCFKIKPLLVTV